MKQFRNVSTLIFDLGGVLVNLDRERCIRNFEQLGIKNTAEIISNTAQKGLFLDFEKGYIGVDEFRNQLRSMSSHKLTDDQIDQAWGSFLLDIPRQKLAMLLTLKQRFRMLMLSNTNPIHIDYCFRTFFGSDGRSVTDYFDTCYLSYEMGMAKPEPGIFTAILDEMNVKPQECLFLDDGTANIEQASKLGFQTYLVSPHEDLDFLLDAKTWGA